jgi:glycosyltransferase involved in cell wall biosynthesis
VDNAFFATRAAAWQHPETRAQLRRELGLTPASFVVLFCGKLQPKKRSADVIEAVARLQERSPERPVSLLVDGSGEQEAMLREFAARRDLHTVWQDFVNQSELPRLYAAADCLALPSDWGETWGLVVNEALATGLPCVVSDRVGCAPDLVTPGETGEVFRFGGIEDFTAALHRIMEARAGGHDHAPACRRRADRYSFHRASAGLIEACQTLCRSAAPVKPERRVLACCGGMVVIYGLERSVFDILRVLREDGAAVHCVLNSWEYARVAEAAERISATWATGYYRHRITRRFANPRALLLSVWDMLCTSAQLVREVLQFRPTHILIPEYPAALRNAPALLWCRARGIQVIFPVGNTPGADRFHRRLWRRGLNPLIDRFIGVSRYVERELLACGLPTAKVGHARLTAALRTPAPAPTPAEKDCSRVVYVGQIHPLKGVHLLLDAIGLLRSRGMAVTLEVVGPMNGWIQPAWAGYREALRERAGRPDLQGAVFFLGEREDVPALLARAGIHCCPSMPEQQEALGLVNLEAKQAGTPSVVFPTGALPELIEHGRDGWVCRDCSAEALAEGIAYFLADRTRCLEAGRQARCSAHNFGRETFAGDWRQQFS